MRFASRRIDELLAEDALDARGHVVFVPPEAFHLVEQMPNWRQRLRPHECTPDLAGFKPYRYAE